MTRCKHTGRRGQCQFRAIDGSDYCAKHTNEDARLRGYRIDDPKLRERFEHHLGADSLDTLRQEVVLLRALIEERLNYARNEAESLSAFRGVTSALSTLDKLVNSLSKLERVGSLVLDRETVNKLGARIVDILTTNLNGVEGRDQIVDRVAKEIAQAIADARNEV